MKFFRRIERESERPRMGIYKNDRGGYGICYLGGVLVGNYATQADAKRAIERNYAIYDATIKPKAEK
ncbi:MAG: hypothetical protein E7035_01555 [Verrucomicrobiaceae bacterium]|nr:hypothetical protein [Verrucomicrobiaceae bacterium]